MKSNKGLAKWSAPQDGHRASVADAVIGGGRRWRRITTPHAWVGVQDGDEIVGRYGGISTRHGMYGAYEVVLVTNEQGTFSISGVHLAALVHAAGTLTPEDHVRVIYRGHRETANGHSMKAYELYVEV